MRSDASLRRLKCSPTEKSILPSVLILTRFHLLQIMEVFVRVTGGQCMQSKRGSLWSIAPLALPIRPHGAYNG